MAMVSTGVLMNTIYRNNNVQGGGADPIFLDSLTLYADAIDSEFDTSTNLINSMTDLSGLDNHLIKASDATRPTYTADDGDGLPCVTSDNKYLDATNGYTDETEMTVFIVVKVTAVSSSAEGLWGSNANDLIGAYHASGTPNTLNWTHGSTVDAVGALRDIFDCNIGSKYKIMRFRRKIGTGRAGFMDIHENGQIMMRDTHATGTVTYTPRIGARSGTQAGRLKWRAWLRYDEALTDEQCEAIEAKLNEKFNVFSIPAWCENSLPQVIRYAIANDISSAAGMSKTAYFYPSAGDSTCNGFAPVAEFDAISSGKYVKLFTKAYIWEWNTTEDWLALDTRTATANNKGGLGAGYAGHEASFSEVIADNTGLDAYVMKYGINGAQLDNVSGNSNWNVTNESSTYPTRLNKYILEALNEEVCVNGTNLVLLGFIIHLGTNDAIEASYESIEQNMIDLVNYCRSIYGMEGAKVAICEIFSTSASYPRITEARQALVNVADTLTNVTHIDGMDAVGDTTDNTHPNAQTYVDMASLIAEAFGI